MLCGTGGLTVARYRLLQAEREEDKLKAANLVSDYKKAGERGVWQLHQVVPFRYESVCLPLDKVADTPFYIQRAIVCHYFFFNRYAACTPGS